MQVGSDQAMKSDTEKIAQSTSTQVIFRMPKLEIELFAMDQEHYVDKSKMETPDFSCDAT